MWILTLAHAARSSCSRNKIMHSTNTLASKITWQWHDQCVLFSSWAQFGCLPSRFNVRVYGCKYTQSLRCVCLNCSNEKVTEYSLVANLSCARNSRNHREKSNEINGTQARIWRAVRAQTNRRIRSIQTEWLFASDLAFLLSAISHCIHMAEMWRYFSFMYPQFSVAASVFMRVFSPFRSLLNLRLFIRTVVRRWITKIFVTQKSCFLRYFSIRYAPALCD